MRRPTCPPECGELRPIGAIAAEVVADLRFRRKILRLHRLGDRDPAELLAEIGAERGIRTAIEQTVERFAEIGAGALDAAGGDEFWPSPLHETQPNTEPPGRPATGQLGAIQPHD